MSGLVEVARAKRGFPRRARQCCGRVELARISSPANARKLCSVVVVDDRQWRRRRVTAATPGGKRRGVPARARSPLSLRSKDAQNDWHRRRDACTLRIKSVHVRARPFAFRSAPGATRDRNRTRPARSRGRLCRCRGRPSANSLVWPDPNNVWRCRFMSESRGGGSPSGGGGACRSNAKPVSLPHPSQHIAHKITSSAHTPDVRFA